MTKEQLKKLLYSLWRNENTFKTINLISKRKSYYDVKSDKIALWKNIHAKKDGFIDMEGITPVVLCERLALETDVPIYSWLSKELRRKTFVYDFEKKVDGEKKVVKNNGEKKIVKNNGAKKVKKEEEGSEGIGSEASKLPICCVCMKEPRCIILKNCNHLCVCDNCKDKLEKCPMCRLMISGFERVYIS